MKEYHNTPLAPIFSSFAILSFKKKGKEEEDLPGSLNDLNLDGGTLSLSDLGNLSGKKKGDLKAGPKTDLKSDLSSGTKLDGLNDALLSMSAPHDDKKIVDLEASINDLKKHAESSDMNSKVTKGELESMKKDLSQINDSIKSLLNVYEAVSRQYNPFVDSVEDNSHMDVGVRAEERNMVVASNQKSLDIDPEPVSKLPLYDEALAELHSLDPNEPLDRIVKPDAVTTASGVENEILEAEKEVLISAPGPMAPIALDAPKGPAKADSS